MPLPKELKLGEWQRWTESWMIREERLTRDLWLACFKRPPEWTGEDKVCVFVSRGRFDERTRLLEEVKEDICDELLLECFAEEMRRKYLKG